MSFFFSPRHITDYDLYYTMSASSGSGTAYPHEAPEFTRGCGSTIFSFLCNVALVFGNDGLYLFSFHRLRITIELSVLR